jgi:hypothetical protein
MIQKFIPLGSGNADIYELLTLAEAMPERAQHFLVLHTMIKNEPRCSVAVVMKPTEIGEFQPIYICVEGIANPQYKVSKRLQLFREYVQKVGKETIEFTVQPSTFFGDQQLYFQHLIGILRANHLISPLTLPF